MDTAWDIWIAKITPAFVAVTFHLNMYITRYIYIIFISIYLYICNHKITSCLQLQLYSGIDILKCILFYYKFFPLFFLYMTLNNIFVILETICRPVLLLWILFPESKSNKYLITIWIIGIKIIPVARSQIYHTVFSKQRKWT